MGKWLDRLVRISPDMPDHGTDSVDTMGITSTLSVCESHSRGEIKLMITDTRRSCNECANLTEQGVCLAAKALGAARYYRPVRDQPRHCAAFLARTDIAWPLHNNVSVVTVNPMDTWEKKQRRGNKHE